MIVCPKVTVIVPNFNHANYLKLRLDSIFNQTFQDFELIILDDCSTDNSVEIINTYSSHPKVSHILINKLNSNSTFLQWNKGIELAKGKYIWIAESDDWAEPDFLINMVEVLDSNPAIVLCYCDSNVTDEFGSSSNSTREYYIFHQEGMPLFTNNVLSGKDFVCAFMLNINIIPNASAVVFRKSKIRPIQSFKRIGDWKFLIDNLLIGDVAYINKTLNNWRRHPRVVTSNDELQKNETIKMLNDLIISFKNLELETDKAVNALFDLIHKQKYTNFKYNYSLKNLFVFVSYYQGFSWTLLLLKIKFLIGLLKIKFTIK